ncbi:MAG: MliC family protein [Haliea sp.]
MRVLFLFGSLLLAACGSIGPGKPSDSDVPMAAIAAPAQTLVFECSDDYSFIARTGPGEIALWLEDRYQVLGQVRSASGSKYEDGTTVFWSKGVAATLTVDGQEHSDCVSVPARVPWEDARRRGVDFRATGNEPGWYLEMQRDRQILFVGHYGRQRVFTPWVDARVNGDRGQTYHAITEAHDLHIHILQETCSDTMADSVFSHTVRVRLDGSELQGCGMWLEHPWE